MKKAIIIVGASGVGKTTVANLILKDKDRFGFVRSATTRPPRGDENDGEYLYCSKEEFKALIDRGEMLEYTQYGDNFYGTPIFEINRIFDSGKTPLLIIDLFGAKNIASQKLEFCPEIYYIFEDINVIERRLYMRELAIPSAKGLENFIKRKDANIRDYLEIAEIFDIFHAFVRNSVAEDAAHAISAAFSDGLTAPDGIIYFGDERKTVAEELKASAINKIV